VVRNAVWDTFKVEILKNVFMVWFSDMMVVGYTFIMMFIIKFLQKTDGTLQEGVSLLAGYGVMLFSFPFLKNYSFFHAMRLAVIVRKTLISTMYEKISSLSIKSITQTNSGKLVTIVSGDIQSIERALAVVPPVFAAPFTNLVVYIIIGYTSSWENSLICFAMWILIMILQWLAAKRQKSLKI
jgi:ABC-type transport system involved in cytochrome bd biosynthesis fused ATPase/permease subunit